MITTTLEVKATRSDVKRYQELLRADWSPETLDHIFSLLWKLIGAKPEICLNSLETCGSRPTRSRNRPGSLTQR